MLDEFVATIRWNEKVYEEENVGRTVEDDGREDDTEHHLKV